MKSIMFFIFTCMLLLNLEQASSQQYGFQYESGRLFQDPQTQRTISSPYLRFMLGGEQQWIAYDPLVRDGRFYSTFSTYAGVVSCGYIRGVFNFLGTTIRTSSAQNTAVAVHVSPAQHVYWTHEHTQANSLFTSVVKQPNGMAILTGYEYTDLERLDKGPHMALLKCIDRNGTIVWEREVPDALGWDIQLRGSDNLYWYVVKNVGNSSRTEIHRIDPSTGKSNWSIVEKYWIDGTTPMSNLKIEVTPGGSIVTARMSGDHETLYITNYNVKGELNWSESYPVVNDAYSNFELKGIAQRDNGQYQIIANLQGTLGMANGRVTTQSQNDKDLFILTLDHQGSIVGHEHYGSDYVSANNLQKTSKGVILTGAHMGTLQVQDTVLKVKDNLDHGFAINLDEYRGFNELSIDVSDSTWLGQLSPLTVYPNPSPAGILHVTYDEVKPNINYQISVYNSDGSFERNLVSQTADIQLKTQVNTLGLPIGVHYAFLSQEGRIISTAKFIIQ